MWMACGPVMCSALSLPTDCKHCRSFCWEESCHFFSFVCLKSMPKWKIAHEWHANEGNQNERTHLLAAMQWNWTVIFLLLKRIVYENISWRKKKQEENTNKFIKICVFFCRYAKGISLWKNLAVLFFSILWKLNFRKCNKVYFVQVGNYWCHLCAIYIHLPFTKL